MVSGKFTTQLLQSANKTAFTLPAFPTQNEEAV